MVLNPGRREKDAEEEAINIGWRRRILMLPVPHIQPACFFVNPTHLGLNEILDGDIPRIAKEDADRLERHYLQEGDILIARRGEFHLLELLSHYAKLGEANRETWQGRQEPLEKMMFRHQDRHGRQLRLSA